MFMHGCITDNNPPLILDTLDRSTIFVHRDAPPARSVARSFLGSGLQKAHTPVGQFVACYLELPTCARSTLILVIQATCQISPARTHARTSHVVATPFLSEEKKERNVSAPWRRALVRVRPLPRKKKKKRCARGGGSGGEAATAGRTRTCPGRPAVRGSVRPRCHAPCAARGGRTRTRSARQLAGPPSDVPATATDHGGVVVWCPLAPCCAVQLGDAAGATWRLASAGAGGPTWTPGPASGFGYGCGARMVWWRERTAG